MSLAAHIVVLGVSFLCGTFAYRSLKEARAAARMLTQPTRVMVVELIECGIWLGFLVLLTFMSAS